MLQNQRESALVRHASWNRRDGTEFDWVSLSIRHLIGPIDVAQDHNNRIDSFKVLPSLAEVSYTHVWLGTWYIRTLVEERTFEIPPVQTYVLLYKADRIAKSRWTNANFETYICPLSTALFRILNQKIQIYSNLPFNRQILPRTFHNVVCRCKRCEMKILLQDAIKD